MAEIEISILISLAAIALLAGFFDAIAGGGGLITLPALFIAGVDPIAAIATNKFQSALATVSATTAFARKGLIQWRTGMPMAALAFLGGGIGALSVSIIPKNLLEGIVPILLILVALYFALAPKLNNEEKKAKLSIFAFSFAVIPLISFYDGVFGPGVGSFYMIAFVIFAGQGILRAMSNTKLVNAASNLGALLIFAIQDSIIFSIAIAMAAGAMIGSQIGARCAIKFGSRLIKPLVIIICCAMAGKLLLNSENPLRGFISSFL